MKSNILNFRLNGAGRRKQHQHQEVTVTQVVVWNLEPHRIQTKIFENPILKLLAIHTFIQEDEFISVIFF